MTALNMLRLSFETRRLFELARQQRLPVREIDLGYLVHALSLALFGEDAPKPFSIEGEQNGNADSGRFTRVLAYSLMSLEQLKQRAAELALPEHYAACDWESSASKPMPQLAPKRIVSFEVRSSPTVRTRKESPGHSSSGRDNSREVDAFLAECWRKAGAVVERADVYADWLRRELARENAAELRDFKLSGFRRQKMLRKGARVEERGRTRTMLERPDALLSGVLEVRDEQAFERLLARGVGRHRAFGYGMLLLKPHR